MVTQTTCGIEVSVSVRFCPETSFIDENSYIFKYTIQISNHSENNVKLVSRKWYIFDSLNAPTHVDGYGVVGKQPVIFKNKKHIYSSFCEIKSDMGYMEGFYVFLNLDTNEHFDVIIPRFNLYYPWKRN